VPAIVSVRLASLKRCLNGSVGSRHRARSVITIRTIVLLAVPLKRASETGVHSDVANAASAQVPLSL
jgi:hypothetical protein